MSNDSKTGRRYGEKEISAILKRAAELQESREHSDLPGRRISISEIEQIAGGVGIDARYIREAIAELDRGDPAGEGFNLWGAPMMIEAERAIQGEISEEQWEMIVQEMRRSTGEIGEAGQLGKSLEWTYGKEGLSKTHLVLSPRDGQTRILITYEYGSGAFLSYFLAMFTGLVILLPVLIKTLTFSPLIEWTMGIGSLFFIFLLVRSLIGIFYRRQIGRITNLASKLEDICADSMPAQISQPASFEATPLLEEPAQARLVISDEPEEQQTTQPQRKIPTT